MPLDRQPEPPRNPDANGTGVVLVTDDLGRIDLPGTGGTDQPSRATGQAHPTRPAISRPKPRHGTRSCYVTGCRRPECRAANTAYQRRHTRPLRNPKGSRGFDPTAAVRRDGLTAEQWDTVLAHTGLINHVLRKMRATYDNEWDDAYQDGLFGLMRATQKFDPDRGHRFSTYAVPWIRQAIARGRGEEMGINYRRAVLVERTGEYERPLSLDFTVDTGDSTVTPAALIPVDDDTEAEALANLITAEVEVALERACRDDLDRAIAATMLGQPHRVVEIAAAHDVVPMTVQNRRRRLRAAVADAWGLQGPSGAARGTGEAA